MKICAIICEYNPMHTGHLYQLLKASKQFDRTICIMSGNFVQRAEPAIAEKSIRARTALDCGADMVIELPVIYATANGEKFANGAISILKELTDIDSLVMGCETDDFESLKTIADIQANESDEMKDNIARFLSDGVSYATALTKATVIEAKKREISQPVTETILSAPNNLLCIEYIKAIEKNGLSIKPVFVKRVGNGYNNKSIFGNYLSATAIREIIARNDFMTAIPYLAGDGYQFVEQLKAHSVNYDEFSTIAVHTLKNGGTQKIASAFDCKEGIEYKLYDNATKFFTLSEVLSSTKSKRYTMSRLKRIVLQTMLGITKEIMTADFVAPPRLLAIKETFKPYLTNNAEKMIIQAKDAENFVGKYYDEYFEIERKANTLYSQITKNAQIVSPQQKIYSR